MGVAVVLLPYVVVATALLALAALRSWNVFDAKVDLLLAVVLSVVAATVAGAVDLGTDAPAYREHYSQLLYLESAYSWWDPGFVAVARLFAWLDAPYGVFAFACVLLSHLIKLYVFNEMVSNRLLALFIVFCLGIGEIGFVRQYLAASLILLTYLLMVRGKVWGALLVILLATLLHKTALIPGLVVILACYGFRSVKPLTALGLAILLVMVALPSMRSELFDRIEFQMASYALEEFVQGVGPGQVALFKNVAKFFAYIAFSAWMLILASRSGKEEIQGRAAVIAIYLSLLSTILIVAISPVFARISTFVFPFLALSVRAERFGPYPSQFAGQYAAALLLVVNLVVAIYPLAEYF